MKGERKRGGHGMCKEELMLDIEDVTECSEFSFKLYTTLKAFEDGALKR